MKDSFRAEEARCVGFDSMIVNNNRLFEGFFLFYVLYFDFFMMSRVWIPAQRGASRGTAGRLPAAANSC